MSTRIDDFICFSLNENERETYHGEWRINATLELDYNGAPFYTVTDYTIKGKKFVYGKYQLTWLDEVVESIALEYWTDDLINSIFEHHDAGLDYYQEQYRERIEEDREYQKAVA